MILSKGTPFGKKVFPIKLYEEKTKKSDAVEVLNECRLDFENKLADEYADNYNLYKVVGTDNHSGWCNKLCGIQLARRLKSVDDMIKAIKNGETGIFKMILK